MTKLDLRILRGRPVLVEADQPEPNWPDSWEPAPTTCRWADLARRHIEATEINEPTNFEATHVNPALS